MSETPSFSCLTCGYDVSSIETPRCPECGAALAEQDRAAMARLRPILDEGDAIPWRHIVAWALVIVIYSIGAEFMKGRDTAPALIIGPILLSLACFGSFALGSVVLLGCDRTKRLAAQHTWRRELWVLHIPWLLIAPASVVMLGASYIAIAAGLGLIATIWTGLAVLALWLPCSLAAPFVFMRRVRRRLASTGADTGAIRRRLWLAALFVLAFAMLLGLAGALVARYGAATMAGYADPPPDGI